ncbi:Replicase polyprotein 1a [Frankliniella fusca]|uniref:Replicase polyprotein 1a n=1 Tax=Frankliniella fusca TaxID=407009 RepID=A0AAE1LCP2_9NEOP|nr:Replicase polyprotein 1a [Frankliniella fusca]
MKEMYERTEKAVQESLFRHDVHGDIFRTTLKYVKLSQGDLVGCLEHMHEVSQKKNQILSDDEDAFCL